MTYRSVFLISLACCAVFLAAPDSAWGQMTVRDVPLNRTAAWKKNVAMLQENRFSRTVPPLPVSGVPAVSVSRAAFLTGEVPQEWIPRIRRASSRHGVAEALLAAVLKAESNFNPYAVSPKGAKGAMQIMPGTGRDLGLRNFFDPEENLDAGAAYLASMLREFSSLELALAAYNAGPGAVRRHGGIPPYEETQTYVVRVLSLFNRYSGQLR